MSQKGMVIDLERCMGCRACVMACKTENETPRGAFWMNVFRYEDGEFPDVEQGFQPNPCHHCTEPSCVDVCPTTARFKREDDGIVLTDYDTCIGCRYCEVGCPYGVNYFAWREPDKGQYGFDESGEEEVHDGESLADILRSHDEDYEGALPWSDPSLDVEIEPRGTEMAGSPPTGTMGKCTFCVHRQDSDDPELQDTTACEEVCPTNVIHFGDMDDPESDPSQHLQEKRNTNRFRMLEGSGNKPNVVYLGDKPNEGVRNMEDDYKNVDDAIDAEAARSGGDWL